MKIGINLTFLTEDSGGSATYAQGLLGGIRRVRPDAALTAWVGRDAPSPRWLEDVDVIRLPVKGVGGLAHYAWDLGMMVPQARRRRLDVLHGLAYVAPPVHPGVPVLVTILDTIWKRYPATMDRRGRVAFNACSRLLGRTADRVLAISESGRRDLVGDLGIARERIDVTPLAVTPPADDAFPAAELPELRTRLGMGPGPVVLGVSQMRAHKNLDAAVDAIALMPGSAQLVLPGTPNAYERSLREASRPASATWPSVCTAVAGSRTGPRGLYALAACCRPPSLRRASACRLLEAMARGVAVACSNCPPAQWPETPRSCSTRTTRRESRGGDPRLRDDELRRRLVTAGRDGSGTALGANSAATLTLPAATDAAHARRDRGGGADARRPQPRLPRARRDGRHGDLRPGADPAPRGDEAIRGSPPSSIRRRLTWAEAHGTTCPTVWCRSGRATGWSGYAASSSTCPGWAVKPAVRSMHSLGSTAPLRGRFRRVSTIHDLHYKLVPEAHFGLLRAGMGVLVPASAWRSHRVIAGLEVDRG